MSAFVTAIAGIAAVLFAMILSCSIGYMAGKCEEKRATRESVLGAAGLCGALAIAFAIAAIALLLIRS